MGSHAFCHLNVKEPELTNRLLDAGVGSRTGSEEEARLHGTRGHLDQAPCDRPADSSAHRESDAVSVNVLLVDKFTPFVAPDRPALPMLSLSRLTWHLPSTYPESARERATIRARKETLAFR